MKRLFLSFARLVTPRCTPVRAKSVSLLAEFCRLGIERSLASLELYSAGGLCWFRFTDEELVCFLCRVRPI